MKYVNAILSGTSYVASSITQKALVNGMPPAISIELTNYCNLHCPECPSGAATMKRERGFMDVGSFIGILNQLKPYLLRMNLYFQGESMMHPGFFEILGRVRGIGSTVSTNGHFLSPENSEKIAKSGLGRLIVSLDGMDQESYSAYRVNGDFQKVIDGISNVSAAIRQHGSKVKLEIQVLVNRFNEDQLKGFREFAFKNNASLKLKSMQIDDTGKSEIWLPADSSFRRYDLQNGSYSIRNTMPRRCARLWFNPVITWDCKVVPCCFDKDAGHVMGDMKRESFREIWYGRKYRDFRTSILKARETIEICRNCTSGMRGIKT